MREALDATNSIHQKMDWPVVTNWVDCSSDWAMQSMPQGRQLLFIVTRFCARFGMNGLHNRLSFGILS